MIDIRRNVINGILGFCCLILVSCSFPTVYNLHILDRLPHEEEKGFVQIVGQTEQVGTQGSSIFWGQLTYSIMKSEHNYTVDILEIPVSMTSKPISDRPGSNYYIIKFPKKVLLLNPDTYIGEGGGASENFASAIGSVLYSKKEDVWVSEDDFKQENFELKSGQKRLVIYALEKIKVEIKKGMVSPVTLKYQVSLDQDGTVQQYTGNLISVETEKPTPIEFFEDLPKGIFRGPKIYKVNFEKLFSKILETSKKLDWDVEYSGKDEGKLIFKISRFPANSLFFTVGIYKLEDEKTGVTISSDSIWQRWGSFNTNISVENINNFFKTLDETVNI